MKNLILAAILTLFAGAAHAACNNPNPNLLGPPFTDNCKLPAAGLNRLIVNPTIGQFLQVGAPPSAPSTWLDSINVNGTNPYGYLAKFGTSVMATVYGEPAIVGAVQTSQTPFPNVCCAIGVTASTINNNTAHPQGAWLFYGTGARLAGAGSLVSEIDIFNGGSLVANDPFTGVAAGSTIALALQCGGEPIAAGLTGSHCSAGLRLGANGDTFDKGIVFDQSIGTIHTMVMGVNQRTEWYSSTATTAAYVTSLVTAAANANAMIFTDFGAFFINGNSAYVSGNANVNFQIGNDPGVSVVNRLGTQGAGTGNPGLLFAVGNDTDVSIDLLPQGAGSVILSTNTVKLPGVQTGTPTASLCIDAGGTIIKKTTAGSCV